MLGFFPPQRYKALVSRKGEDADDSRESVQPADGLMHINETASDCSDKNLLSDDTDLATNLKSLQPVVTLTQLKMQIQGEEKGKLAEPEATSEDLSTTSATITSNMDTSPAEVPASSSVDMDSEPSASAEDATEELEEREAPATQGKKIGTGKAPRRRSGRAANRRWGNDVHRKETGTITTTDRMWLKRCFHGTETKELAVELLTALESWN